MQPVRRAAVAAAIALVCAGSAGAHGIGPHAGLVNTVVGTEPLVPGIRAQVRGTHERIVVRNYTPKPVVFFDGAGRPFKRLGPGETETWPEPRISWKGPVPQQPGPLKRWRIPGETDGRRFAIVGFLGYVPPPQTAPSSADTSPWLIAGAIAGGVLALLGLGVGARLAQRAPTS
jgi:hypothetical protein